MATKKPDASEPRRLFKSEFLKFFLSGIIGAGITFGLQYKSWNEQEKLDAAKSYYDRGYQAVMDFSELYHKRFFAFRRMQRQYEKGMPVEEADKKLYMENFYEWNYKIETFIKRFETLIDQPYFESNPKFNSKTLAIGYKNWQDVNCQKLFYTKNGSDPRWDLMKFYPKVFDHCFSQSTAVTEQLLSGATNIPPDKFKQAVDIYTISYYNMNIIRQEALKRVLCNYNERKTDNFLTFLGLRKRDAARKLPECKVEERIEPPAPGSTPKQEIPMVTAPITPKPVAASAAATGPALEAAPATR